MKVVVIKDRNMDYVNKTSGERVIATSGKLIFDDGEKLNVADYFLKVDSLDYPILSSLSKPTVMSCDYVPYMTKTGLALKFNNYKAIEEIDLISILRKK